MIRSFFSTELILEVNDSQGHDELINGNEFTISTLERSILRNSKWDLQYPFDEYHCIYNIRHLLANCRRNIYDPIGCVCLSARESICLSLNIVILIFALPGKRNERMNNCCARQPIQPNIKQQIIYMKKNKKLRNLYTDDKRIYIQISLV